MFDLDINILKMSSSNTQETAKKTSSQMQNNQKKAGKQVKTIQKLSFRLINCLKMQNQLKKKNQISQLKVLLKKPATNQKLI